MAVDRAPTRATSLDRVLWPDTGTTKGDILDYYRAIAPVLLPHLRGRGLTLRRFPSGVTGSSWYTAECRGRPDWMRTMPMTNREGRTFNYCVVDDLDGLLWAANVGAIELHPFLSRMERPNEPTMLVVDLDPGRPAGILDAARVALRARRILERIGLVPHVKTTGSVGLHVVARVPAGTTFEQTKALARRLAAHLARRSGGAVVDVADRRRRSGRVFLDWVQNDPTRSTVAPYSLRAMAWPLVATPITWDELEAALRTANARSLWFGPVDVLRRVERLGDIAADLA